MKGIVIFHDVDDVIVIPRSEVRRVRMSNAQNVIVTLVSQLELSVDTEYSNQDDVDLMVDDLTNPVADFRTCTTWHKMSGRKDDNPSNEVDVWKREVA